MQVTQCQNCIQHLPSNLSKILRLKDVELLIFLLLCVYNVGFFQFTGPDFI